MEDLILSLKKINNQHVKEIKLPKKDMRAIKGFDICPELYANIFVCAKKKSGKTSVLFKILKECSTKNTVIVVFCSTIHKDANWIQIRKYFEKKGIDLRIFTSIYDGGEDQLLTLINDLQDEAKEKEEKQDEETEPEDTRCDDILLQLEQMNSYAVGKTLVKSCDDDEKVEKIKSSKFQYPEYIIVFDDLSSELKSRSVLSLLKFNRHFKTKIILSSQWVHDLLPESRKQIDLFLVFKGFTAKKMKEIYNDCDTSLPFEIFYQIYQQATKKPFSFLFIDSRSDKFRINFDKEFVIQSNDVV